MTYQAVCRIWTFETSLFQRIDVCTHLDWLSQKSFLAQVPWFHFGLSHFLQCHTFQTSSFVLFTRNWRKPATRCGEDSRERTGRLVAAPVATLSIHEDTKDFGMTVRLLSITCIWRAKQCVGRLKMLWLGALVVLRSVSL